MTSSGNQYAQNLSAWNIGAGEPGSLAGMLEGTNEAPTMPALFAFYFGVFFEPKSTGQDKVASGTTKIAGPTMINQLAADYANRKYTIGEPTAALQKGEAWVKIDADNPPAVRGALYVSYASGTEGYLVGVGASSKLTITAGQGIEVREVTSIAARVYVDGAVSYVVS